MDISFMEEAPTVVQRRLGFRDALRRGGGLTPRATLVQTAQAASRKAKVSRPTLFVCFQPHRQGGAAQTAGAGCGHTLTVQTVFHAGGGGIVLPQVARVVKQQQQEFLGTSGKPHNPTKGLPSGYLSDKLIARVRRSPPLSHSPFLFVFGVILVGSLNSLYMPCTR